MRLSIARDAPKGKGRGERQDDHTTEKALSPTKEEGFFSQSKTVISGRHA